MKKLRSPILLLFFLVLYGRSFACSIVYYIDSETGNIYFVNNEDYFYDVKPYIQIKPASKKALGRIWYGWKKFGQGGVNEKGLVIDGTATPEQEIPAGYSAPKGNITDEILAACSTVDEAVAWLEAKKIALDNAHILLGDQKGKAVLIEWVNGVKKTVEIQNNRLVATNFHLSDTAQTARACRRYPLLQKGLDALDARDAKDTITLKDVGNVLGKAVQLPQADASGRMGGTLYTTFIDLSNMQLVFVYKLTNASIRRFDILNELQTGKARRIRLR